MSNTPLRLTVRKLAPNAPVGARAAYPTQITSMKGLDGLFVVDIAKGQTKHPLFHKVIAHINTQAQGECQGRTWSKNYIEAHYRREGSPSWYVCKVQRGDQFISKVGTVAEAEQVMREWLKAARGLTMDCAGLTISFPPNTTHYEFRIVRTKSEFETLKHVQP